MAYKDEFTTEWWRKRRRELDAKAAAKKANDASEFSENFTPSGARLEWLITNQVFLNGREDIAELARVCVDLALDHAVQVIARDQGKSVAKRAMRSINAERAAREMDGAPVAGYDSLDACVRSGANEYRRAVENGFAEEEEGRKSSVEYRLDSANRHFRKKAAVVFGDGDAVRLLARLYQSTTVDVADFDACEDSVSLAKLTAANFCEIGAKSIYITEAGQNFIDAVNSEE